MGQRDDRWEHWVAGRLGARNLHLPSEGALRKAIALGSRLEANTSRGWFMELLFDSVAEPLPAGVRAAASAQRRLLYRANSNTPGLPPCQLDLRLRKEPAGTIEVTGQLLPPGAAVRVELRAGRTKRRKALGKSGEFMVRGVPARGDSFSLEIETADGQSMVVDDVPISFSNSEPS